MQISEILQPLDDVDCAAGLCEWSEVANARDEIRRRLEAALSAAEAVEQDENPMRFFADNVDKWGPLEWFNRLVDACEDHDRKRTQAFRCADPDEKDMLSLSADTSKMIMSSSAFRLAREHKDEIRSALSAQVQDEAGWQPIETAPKDGSTFLAVMAEAYSPRTTLCKFENGGFLSPSQGEKFVVPGWNQWWPTHWMPLPAAPAKQEG